MLGWFFIACAPRVEPWDAPKPPDLFALAEKFSEPRGSLDQEKAEELTDWLLGDGGIAILGSAMVFQTIFPALFAELENGLSEDSDEEEEGNTSGNENINLDGDGWLRLTMPCGGEDIAQSSMVVNSLFSKEGLDPRLWGSTVNCEWPDAQLRLNADIGFLVPFVSPMIDQSVWEGEEGKWFSVEGDMNIFDYEVQNAFQLMLDSENQVRILWESGGARFIIRAPVIDSDTIQLSTESLDDIMNLNIGITTEEGQWDCVVADANCSGPADQELGW